MFSSVVVLSNLNCDVSVVLEEIYGNLTPELIDKIKSLTAVNGLAGED